MSEPGATARRRRSRRATPHASRVRRPLIAIASVVLVLTPISWILLHEPQSDQADASIPYVTRDDDRYVTASADPAAVTTDAPTTATPSTPPTPGESPTTTPAPSTPPTPGETPGTTTDPTTTPTDRPTDRPTDGTTSTPTDPPTAGTTTTPPPQPPDEDSPDPQPSRTPSRTPTTTAPPEDDGNMSASEEELFRLVDNARQDRGCAPLRRDNDLSASAGSEAEDRAASGDLSATGPSMAAAGGDGMTAKAAFDRLKAESSRTLFNCGLDELGVGRDDFRYCSARVIVCIARSTRYAWVVDFD